jgi:hypothetical protein
MTLGGSGHVNVIDAAAEDLDFEMADTAAPLRRRQPSVSSGGDATGAASRYRQGWTRRYISPEVESAYLVFAHANPWGRLALIYLLQIVSVSILLVRYFDSNSAPSSGIVVLATGFLFFAAMSMIIAPLTLECVARRLTWPALTPAARALISEILIASVPVLVRLTEVSFHRTSMSVPTADGGTLHRTLISEKTGSIIWYMTFAPPRLISAVPGFVAILVAHAAVLPGKAPLDLVDWCGASLVVVEVAVAAGLIWTWEALRRRNFEVRTNLEHQAALGAALVATLNTELRRCLLSRSWSLPASGADVVSSTAVVVAVRTAATLTMVAKKRLIDAADAVAACIASDAIVRFSSSGEVLCFVVNLFDKSRSELDTSTGVHIDDPCIAACVFARLLQRLYATSGGYDTIEDAQLHIGIDVGVIRATAPNAQRANDLVVTGPPLKAALRYSELALPGCILVSDHVKAVAASAYSLLLLCDVEQEELRTGLHLLGMPWTDEGSRLEAELRAAQADAAAHARENGRPLGRTASYTTTQTTGTETTHVTLLTTVPSAATLRDSPTISSVVPRGQALIDADQQQIVFTWSWFFGWGFTDSEVESDFRAQEVNGRPRLVPAVTMLVTACVVLGWLLESGSSQMTLLSWGSWIGAFLANVLVVVLATPNALGQKRLVFLLFLTRSFIILLTLAVRYQDDYANPMRFYMVDFINHFLMGATMWVPTCVPIPLLAVFNISWMYLVSPTSDDFQMRVIQPLVTFVLDFALIQTLRVRNRVLFADMLAASLSRERWDTARDQLQATFQTFLPAEVATRVVADGTLSRASSPMRKSLGPERSSSLLVEAGATSGKHARVKTYDDGAKQLDEDDVAAENVESARFTLRSPRAIVVAFTIVPIPPHLWAAKGASSADSTSDTCSTSSWSCCSVESGDTSDEERLHLAYLAAYRQTRVAIAADPSINLFFSGTHWLAVVFDDAAEAGASEELDRLIDAIAALRELEHFRVVSGVGIGEITGDLCGHVHRHYELVGPAVTSAIRALDANVAYDPTKPSAEPCQWPGSLLAVPDK